MYMVVSGARLYLHNYTIEFINIIILTFSQYNALQFSTK